MLIIIHISVRKCGPFPLLYFAFLWGWLLAILQQEQITEKLKDQEMLKNHQEKEEDLTGGNSQRDNLKNYSSVIWSVYCVSESFKGLGAKGPSL